MNSFIISGIQQMGIGVPNVYEAFTWYRKYFGMDIKVFEEAAEANLMLPYTGGKPQKRHAILAVNLNGGGGFEIWQYTSRTPQKPTFEISLGDYGLFITKMKCRNIQTYYNQLKTEGVNIISNIQKDPAGTSYFFVNDLYGNIFQIVESNNWFSNQKSLCGGVYGAVIGVSNIERSLPLYQNILGFDKIVYETTQQSDEWASLPGGTRKVRRVLLTNSKLPQGPFANLLGNRYIELIQTFDYTGKKIFENRYWGDCGFIHLCFDIRNMKALQQACEKEGYKFTVDSSGNFDMGEAAGHFTYIEDPDGTLIEFVETFKVPILKKFGLFLNLKNRNPQKKLPNWMIKAMSLNRVRE
jgi:catechol 2,3-dioxygenase-like lactoylglutathione lyase family enzyme